MAFTCTAYHPRCLNESVQNTPIGPAIITSIGFDTEKPFTYYFFACMYPSQGSVEFVFGIRPRNNLKSTYEPAIFDARDARALTGEAHKSRINEILIRFTESLMVVAPGVFFMETFNPYLPAKALPKYERLCGVFIQFGYNVVREQTSSEKYVWKMNKIN